MKKSNNVFLRVYMSIFFKMANFFPDLEIAYIGVFGTQEHEYGQDLSLPVYIKGSTCRISQKSLVILNFKFMRQNCNFRKNRRLAPQEYIIRIFQNYPGSWRQKIPINPIQRSTDEIEIFVKIDVWTLISTSKDFFLGKFVLSRLQYREGTAIKFIWSTFFLIFICLTGLHLKWDHEWKSVWVCGYNAKTVLNSLKGIWSKTQFPKVAAYWQITLVFQC